MKKLSQNEIARLGALLRRAVAHAQLNLHVASPYPNGQWKRAGWAFNDRHDGFATASNTWNVEEAGDEVGVFVDQRSLNYLALGTIGARTSPAKAAAARRNGRLGGRPRKASNSQAETRAD